jgi:hypothetical protein
LGQGHEHVGFDYARVIDILIRNHDLGPCGAAPRFRAVGLGLDSTFTGIYSTFAEYPASEYDSLATEAS